MTAKKKTKKKPALIKRQAAAGLVGTSESALGKPQEIGFFGHKANEHHSFAVLAGETAPTLTGGWLKLAKVQRFQRVSITVPEGYDPLVLSVPILFNAVVITEEGLYQQGQYIEERIGELEWMAGRAGHPHSEIKGEPPYVEVYSLDANGNQTNLIPKQFQTVPGSSQQWYITQITYDANPIRDKYGDRIRQAATVELTEVVLSPSALSNARVEREQNKGKYQTVLTTSGVNTVRRIAAQQGIPAAWKGILKYNANLGNNPDKALRAGTPVKIPNEYYLQVPR